jgi:hypothetical protein
MSRSVQQEGAEMRPELEERFQWRQLCCRWLVIMCVVVMVSLVHTAIAYQWFYSPADSILYFQYFRGDLGGHIILRFRDGGRRVERSQAVVHQYILTTDDIPGHVFTFADAQDYDSLMRSNDYGETWTQIYGIASGGWAVEAKSGDHSGESSMLVEYAWNQEWIFHTQGSWQTYDSSRVNMRLNEEGDSLWRVGLTFQTGGAYGIARDTVVCISSDFGQTWTRGSKPQCQQPLFFYAGALGELWWWQNENDSVFVSLDTARTMAYAYSYAGHLPPRPLPYVWMIQFIPTNLPGEAYLVAYIDYWHATPDGEFVIYHLRDYGAEMDSSYHYLVDYWPEVVDAPHPVPKQYQFSAYPNPFNTTVTIQWQKLSTLTSTVVITDLLGRRVWQWRGNSDHILWNGRSNSGVCLPSGKYWISIQHGIIQPQTQSIILLR